MNNTDPTYSSIKVSTDLGRFDDEDKDLFKEGGDN